MVEARGETVAAGSRVAAAAAAVLRSARSISDIFVA